MKARGKKANKCNTHVHQEKEQRPVRFCFVYIYGYFILFYCVWVEVLVELKCEMGIQDGLEDKRLVTNRHDRTQACEIK